jgi:hypothetical protein
MRLRQRAVARIPVAVVVVIPEVAMSYFNGGSHGNFSNAVSTRGGSNKESEGSRTSFAGGFFSILEHKSVCCYSKSESEGSRTSFAGGCFSILDDMSVCCDSKAESESSRTSFAGGFFPIHGVWSFCCEPTSESAGARF